ncbi:MAG TPA: VCBS repeat-containing protein [Candidatus Polarisedimenticolia bacterium]|nr:VCBS repeat-containing protein [Candidatus Polarisedimenticolia bacterium]
MPPGSLSNLRLRLAVAALATAAVIPVASGTPLRSVPPFAPGFPIPIPRPVEYRPRWGSTVTVDLDRDGRAELLASIPSGDLLLIERGGARVSRWPPSLHDLPQPAWPVGEPGIGDLDGDGQDEVVACLNTGTTPRRAFLVAWRRDGSRVDGWPVEIPTLDPRAACSPGGTLMADLDRDGRAEVVQAIAPAEIDVYDGAGRPLAGWPFHPPRRASGVAPALNARLAAADVDGDGTLEVIAVESGLAPLLHAIGPAGAEAHWYPRLLPEVVSEQAPAAADLDGDGMAEVVQSTLPASTDFLRPLPSRLAIPVLPMEGATPVAGPPGALHTLHHDGGEAIGWPVPLSEGALWGSILADLDGDGRDEILQGDGDLLHGFDAEGRALKGFPLTMRRLFTRAAARLDSGWVAGDLDGDGALDVMRALGRMDAGGTALRIAAIQSRNGAPVPGTPWTIEGLLPASNPTLVDLTGDGRPEVAVLAVDGITGGWRLLAWNVAAFRGLGAGTKADTLRGWSPGTIGPVPLGADPR